MILITSLLTGVSAAMLRSLFAVILVAFLIGVAFIAAYVLHGASVSGLVTAICGFNVGIVALAAAKVFGTRTHSA